MSKFRDRAKRDKRMDWFDRQRNNAWPGMFVSLELAGYCGKCGLSPPHLPGEECPPCRCGHALDRHMAMEGPCEQVVREYAHPIHSVLVTECCECLKYVAAAKDAGGTGYEVAVDDTEYVKIVEDGEEPSAGDDSPKPWEDEDSDPVDQ